MFIIHGLGVVPAIALMIYKLTNVLAMWLTVWLRELIPVKNSYTQLSSAFRNNIIWVQASMAT